MNKLEKEHFKVIDDNVGCFQSCNDTDPIMFSGKETAATSCGSITKDYAEKFSTWILDNKWQNKDGIWYKPNGWGIRKTTSELWDLFLNDLNEKG